MRARHPALLPPRTRVEETVLDLVDAALTLDDALGWIARACGRRLTTAGRLREAASERPRLRWRREVAAGLSDVREGRCRSSRFVTRATSNAPTGFR